MLKIIVYYLMNGECFSNGQSLVSKPHAMMNKQKLSYYLSTMKKRGLNFSFIAEELEVTEDEYQFYLTAGFEATELTLDAIRNK